jgi:putative endonuclease
MERRLYKHNIGHSKFTRLGIPWELKYTEEYATLLEAKQRALKFKKMKSGKYIEELIAKRNSEPGPAFSGTSSACN